MEVDGVFAGGGVKALAFAGAFRVLESKGIRFKRAGGTSAGALTAAFIRAGYTSQDLLHLFREIDLNSFLDPRPAGEIFPFMRWLYLYRHMGLYRGDSFEEWLAKVLADRGIRTFSDIPGKSLKMTASDLTNGRLIVLPDDLPDYGLSAGSFSVSKAVRMSCSLPFLFEPFKLKGPNGKTAIIADGGILSNFPMWLFVNKGKLKKERPILGLKLSPEYDRLPSRDIKNGLSYLQAMIATMRNAHDQRYVSKIHAKHIIFIPVKEISATDFNLTDKQTAELMQLGEESAKTFLTKWAW